MADKESILKKLYALANAENVKGMEQYGMSGKNRLGVSIPDLRNIAKETGRDHALALRLWKTHICDAMILASMIDENDKLTEKQMEDWVKDFNSWDVCDQVCMNLFEKSPLAHKKIEEWSRRKEEFVIRASYALIACIAWHDKKADDASFKKFFPVIKRGAGDERNYVKKAVSWALRNIGKRNPSLNKAALKLASEIAKTGTGPAKWISSDVTKDLEGRF